MIFKKIPNPKISASKRDRVFRLSSYIRNPETSDENEKCVYYGTRGGFLTKDRVAQQYEMAELATASARSADPIEHYVLSWREGERPSAAQAEEAVTILLDEMGFNGLYVMYGLHADTQNWHLHIMVNRVDPDTEKVRRVEGGPRQGDVEAGHRAVARIEHAQGWQSERNARYCIGQNGRPTLRIPEDRGQHKPRKVGQAKRDKENRTGTKSVERMAIEHAAPIIRDATSWQELHENLAASGFLYTRKGSGALIEMGEVKVKASSVDRAASLAALEKRLGPFQPRGEQVEVKPRKAEPLVEDFELWGEYSEGAGQRVAARKAAVSALRRRQTRDREQLFARQKRHRDSILRGNWRGHGIALNALRSVIAREHAISRACMVSQHKEERRQLAAEYPRWPSFEEFLGGRERPDLAEMWRHRHGGESALEHTLREAPEPVEDQDTASYRDSEEPGSYGLETSENLRLSSRVVPPRALSNWSLKLRVVIRESTPSDNASATAVRRDWFNLDGELVAHLSGDADEVRVESMDVVVATVLALEHAGRSGWADCWVDGDAEFCAMIAARADLLVPPIPIYDRATGAPLNQAALARNARAFGGDVDCGDPGAADIDAMTSVLDEPVPWDHLDDHDEYDDLSPSPRP